MLNEVAIMEVFEDKYFGKREAESIVGGVDRLLALIDEGRIRAEKRSRTQNGKWYCNALDCILHAKPREIVKRNRKR